MDLSILLHLKALFSVKSILVVRCSWDDNIDIATVAINGIGSIEDVSGIGGKAIHDYIAGFDAVYICSMELNLLSEVVDQGNRTVFLDEFIYTGDLIPRFDSRVFVVKRKNSSMMEISELYSILGQDSLLNHLGTYSLNDSLRPLMFPPRKLTGVKMKNAMVPLKNFYEDGRVVGYLGAILDHLTDCLDFQLANIEPTNGQWGAKSNGSWDGVMDMLITREASISASGLSHILSRAEDIDFTFTVDLEKTGILLNKPVGNKMNFWSYITTFEPRIWLVFCACVILVVLVNTVISRTHPHETLASSLLLFLQLDSGTGDVARWSQRIFWVTVALTMSVIFIHYSADLTTTTILWHHTHALGRRGRSIMWPKDPRLTAVILMS